MERDAFGEAEATESCMTDRRISCSLRELLGNARGTVVLALWGTELWQHAYVGFTWCTLSS